MKSNNNSKNKKDIEYYRSNNLKNGLNLFLTIDYNKYE